MRVQPEPGLLEVVAATAAALRNTKGAGLNSIQRRLQPRPNDSSSAAMSCLRIVGAGSAAIGLVGVGDAAVVNDGGLSCSGSIAAVALRRSRLLRLCSTAGRLGCSRSP